MRILMVVRQFYPWIGGTERQAQALSAKLIGKGIHVSVVTGWWDRNTQQREIVESIPVFRNFTCWEMFGLKGLRKFGGYLYMVTLFYYLWRHRDEYDLIHVHLLGYAAFPAVIAGRILKKKTLIKIANSGRDSDIHRMRRNDLIPGEKYMLPYALKANQIVAINDEIIDELHRVGVTDDRVKVIPNGLTLPGVSRKSCYRLQTPITLIFVGRLHPQKGVDILLASFHQLVTTHPEIHWRLWILGDGGLRSALEAQAQALNMAQHVHFLGQVSNVYDYFTQSDLFILPSRAEGMSNALLEAMAHGLPCIATDVRGNANLIQDGKNGLLVPFGDAARLVKAIETLTQDEALRQQLGQAARQSIETHYSMDGVAEQYVTLYEKMLADSRQRVFARHAY